MGRTYNEIRLKVIDITSKQLGVEKVQINDDLTFEQMGADSLDQIELVMSMEEIFNIDISDQEFDNIKNINDTIVHIISKQT